MIIIPKDALGKETILDLHECNIKTFKKDSLEQFCVELCKKIDMIPVQRHTWEYLEDPSKEDFKHYEGHSICQFSVCQFILTSDIILHSWINSGRISLNIFSCKDYDEHKAEEFSAGWFDSKKVRQSITIIRY